MVDTQGNAGAAWAAAPIDRWAPGQTIADRFLDTAATHPDRVALRARRGDGWTELTYRDLAERVGRAAAGLLSLGLEPGDRVALMMRNIPEFHVVDLAAVFCGLIPVSLPPCSPPDQVAYLAGHSRARLAVTEDACFFERFSVMRHELPHVEHAIVLRGSDELGLAGAWPASRLSEREPLDLVEAARRLTPDTPATIVYTSGTTGPPKGVVLTHRNVVWAVQAYLDLLDVDPVGLRTVSYLPMAHVTERMVNYLAVLSGFEVTTCRDPSLVTDHARQVRPQVLFGTPAVWKGIHAGVRAALDTTPEVASRVDAAIAATGPIVDRRAAGTATADDERTWATLDETVLRPLRRLVGLDDLRWAMTGGAPTAPDLVRWYRAVGVPLSESYGLSETTGPVTWAPQGARPGTVGPAVPGVRVFLADDGEICCQGGNVFAGYLDDPQATAAVLDADGTFRTGDLGVMDDDGHVRVVDRKDELIMTADGETVGPAGLEAALETLPPVGRACAVGARRCYVAALLVLDPDAAPAWARERGIEAPSLAALAGDERMAAAVEHEVDRVMTPFDPTERVRRVTVLADQWRPDGEELTPTGKLRRSSIHAKYADQIDAMYR